MAEKYEGLTLEEVTKLQKQYGYNEFVKTEKPSAIKKFLGVFKEPMFILLFGTALLYFLLGEINEACIMMFFVIFVASITFIQEWRTEKTLHALKELTSQEVKVLRDGKEMKIKSSELVPGDIVYLSEGERIPADCEVLKVSNFSVDESVLTGEAEPVFKVTKGSLDNKESAEENKDYWKSDMVYAGTLSIFGKSIVRVVFTGFNTEYGKIGKAIRETKDELTPLQKKVQSLVKNLALVGLVLCILVIGLTYLYNHNIVQSILSGLTLAMGIIPEEFPVVLTVFLSLGAFRLAKKNTIMRKVSAVETLGSTTILAVDKTGTITKNEMTVKSVFYNNFYIPEKFNDEYISNLMVLACEKDPYDPMEKAILQLVSKNINTNSKELNMEIAHKIAFDSKTKRMANIFKAEEGYYVAAKGSPETILPLCSLKDNEKNAILEAIDDMASRGLRVIALADLNTSKVQEDMDEYNLNFRGLIGLQDPPKEGVKEAIELCKNAGIRVIMITGDYNKTAMAVGNEIGLKFKSCAITGEEIDNMSEEELCEAVKHCDIFSRVIPEHKMRIVKALKANGEIVAMTGDGVNDAPALKNADIGIAMGKRGTDVAKEAAHMILMDDNFTTIVNSVRDGRRIFDNIRKAMVYIMVIHIPIMTLALFSPVFNLPQILLPVHIVLLELIIDPTCSIVFEGEEAEPYIMEESPRNPKEPLLTKSMTIKVILQGTAMFLATFLPFHFMVDNGVTVEVARSFALVTLVTSNVILVLVNRSNTQYLYSIFKEKQNKARLFINSLAMIMVFAITYVPFMQPIFKTSNLSLSMLAYSIILGILSSVWWEIVKMYQIKVGKEERLESIS